MTASMVEWPEFLATDPEVLLSIPGATIFFGKTLSGTGPTQSHDDI
jgi:hypothetical protein